ncbi:ATPase [Solibacillus silvestris]|uniref:ATPase n=1 Tax=Solibacillus silvestris TaxID=76853 RepID=UPI003F7ECC86
MKQALFRHYEQQLASWILLTPVCASFFGLILVFKDVELAAYYVLSISVTVLCAIYLDMREKQLRMTSLFPISRKMFFFADLFFLGRYIAYYILYTLTATTIIETLLVKQPVFPSIKQLFISFGISFFIIAIFLGVRRFKFGALINLLIFIVPLAFFQLSPLFNNFAILHGLLFLLGAIVLFISAASFTYFREDRRDIT